MGLALATKVNEEQKTTSLGPTSNRRSAKCIAAVPDDTIEALLTLLYSSSPLSKALTLLPKGAIQFKSNASCMYFCSFPLMCGGERKILLFFFIANFLPIS